MSQEMPDGQPQRKRPAHPPPVERHNEPVVVFLTACVADSTVHLDTQAMHGLLRDAWAAAETWRVGAYMIMPDHVHLFCVPGVFPPVSVKKWASYWKGLVSRALSGYGPLGGTRSTASGVNPQTAGVEAGPPGRRHRSIWQRDCWDTQMRSHAHYVEKRAYVRENPVRKGLVTDTGAWPYQGEIYTIRW